MSWTLCTSGSAILKASVNVNTSIVNYATNKTYLDGLSDKAENDACVLTRSDVITDYSSLTTNGKQVLAKFCEAHIAENLVNYDPDAIGRSTAIAILNVLYTQKQEAIKILTDNNNKKYLGIT